MTLAVIYNNNYNPLMPDDDAAHAPADPIEQLPKAVYRTIIADLHALIPPPTLTDPELIAERVHAAIAQIATMVPVNADEANIALRVVIAEANAKECARHARMYFNDTALLLKCEAQANHCQRTANAARALLLRVQSARHKREANRTTCDQDAWTIHATQGYLLRANGERVSAPPPPPAPKPPSPSPNAADDTSAPGHTEAELYAIMYPRRAAQIRAHGGMPPDASFDRPAPDLLRDLLASTSPILQQIDQEFARS
jgi:hypothetical protein